MRRKYSKLYKTSRFNCFNIKCIMMVIADYIAKAFASGIKQMRYCFRMWITKWYVSIICLYANIWY